MEEDAPPDPDNYQAQIEKLSDKVTYDDSWFGLCTDDRIKLACREIFKVELDTADQHKRKLLRSVDIFKVAEKLNQPARATPLVSVQGTSHLFFRKNYWELANVDKLSVHEWIIKSAKQRDYVEMLRNIGKNWLESQDLISLKVLRKQPNLALSKKFYSAKYLELSDFECEAIDNFKQMVAERLKLLESLAKQNIKTEPDALENGPKIPFHPESVDSVTIKTEFMDVDEVVDESHNLSEKALEVPENETPNAVQEKAPQVLENPAAIEQAIKDENILDSNINPGVSEVVDQIEESTAANSAVEPLCTGSPVEENTKLANEDQLVDGAADLKQDGAVDGPKVHTEPKKTTLEGKDEEEENRRQQVNDSENSPAKLNGTNQLAENTALLPAVGMEPSQKKPELMEIEAKMANQEVQSTSLPVVLKKKKSPFQTSRVTAEETKVKHKVEVTSCNPKEQEARSCKKQKESTQNLKREINKEPLLKREAKKKRIPITGPAGSKRNLPSRSKSSRSISPVSFINTEDVPHAIPRYLPKPPLISSIREKFEDHLLEQKEILADMLRLRAGEKRHSHQTINVTNAFQLGKNVPCIRLELDFIKELTEAEKHSPFVLQEMQAIINKFKLLLAFQEYKVILTRRLANADYGHQSTAALNLKISRVNKLMKTWKFNSVNILPAIEAIQHLLDEEALKMFNKCFEKARTFQQAQVYRKFGFCPFHCYHFSDREVAIMFFGKDFFQLSPHELCCLRVLKGVLCVAVNYSDKELVAIEKKKRNGSYNGMSVPESKKYAAMRSLSYADFKSQICDIEPYLSYRERRHLDLSISELFLGRLDHNIKHRRAHHGNAMKFFQALRQYQGDKKLVAQLEKELDEEEGVPRSVERKPAEKSNKDAKRGSRNNSLDSTTSGKEVLKESKIEEIREEAQILQEELNRLRLEKLKMTVDLSTIAVREERETFAKQTSEPMEVVNEFGCEEFIPVYQPAPAAAQAPQLNFPFQTEEDTEDTGTDVQDELSAPEDVVPEAPMEEATPPHNQIDSTVDIPADNDNSQSETGVESLYSEIRSTENLSQELELEVSSTVPSPVSAPEPQTETTALEIEGKSEGECSDSDEELGSEEEREIQKEIAKKKNLLRILGGENQTKKEEIGATKQKIEEQAAILEKLRNSDKAADVDQSRSDNLLVAPTKRVSPAKKLDLKPTEKNEAPSKTTAFAPILVSLQLKQAQLENLRDKGEAPMELEGDSSPPIEAILTKPTEDVPLPLNILVGQSFLQPLPAPAISQPHSRACLEECDRCGQPGHRNYCCPYKISTGIPVTQLVPCGPNAAGAMLSSKNNRAFVRRVFHQEEEDRAAEKEEKEAAGCPAPTQPPNMQTTETIVTSKAPLLCTPVGAFAQPVRFQIPVVPKAQAIQCVRCEQLGHLAAFCHYQSSVGIPPNVLVPCGPTDFRALLNFSGNKISFVRHRIHQQDEEKEALEKTANAAVEKPPAPNLQAPDVPVTEELPSLLNIQVGRPLATPISVPSKANEVSEKARSFERCLRCNQSGHSMPFCHYQDSTGIPPEELKTCDPKAVGAMLNKKDTIKAKKLGRFVRRKIKPGKEQINDRNKPANSAEKPLAENLKTADIPLPDNIPVGQPLPCPTPESSKAKGAKVVQCSRCKQPGHFTAICPYQCSTGIPASELVPCGAKDFGAMIIGKKVRGFVRRQIFQEEDERIKRKASKVPSDDAEKPPAETLQDPVKNTKPLEKMTIKKRGRKKAAHQAQEDVQEIDGEAIQLIKQLADIGKTPCVLKPASSTHSLRCTILTEFFSIPANTKLWCKFTVKNCDEYSNEYLLSTVLKELPKRSWDFVPIGCHKSGRDTVFFATDCSEAIVFYLRQNLNISVVKKSQQFVLEIEIATNDESLCPFNVDNLIFEVMRRKQGGQTLNLSNFHQSEEISHYCYYPLWTPKNIGSVFEYAQVESKTQYSSINLSGNGLQFLGYLSLLLLDPTIKFYCSVTSLDLRNNEITKARFMSSVSSGFLQIKELFLDGNPMCNEYSSAKDYVTDVTGIFTNLEFLDGCKLTKIKENEHKQVFFCDPSAQSFLEQFLAQYFSIFDSNRRDLLLGLYRDETLFSLTCSLLEKQSTSDNADLGKYLSISRNLKTLIDCSKSEGKLLKGKCGVVEYLKRFPSTRHECDSFTADVSAYSEKCTKISVSGLFQEIEHENAPVRHFYRVFVLTSESGVFSISNEMIFISNCTTAQNEAHKFSQKEDSEEIDLIFDIKPFGNHVTKDDVVAKMVRITGMKDEWCWRCLEDQEWNLRNALIFFQKLYEEEKIPGEAFQST